MGGIFKKPLPPPRNMELERQLAAERAAELQIQQQKADQQAEIGNTKNDIAQQRLEQQAELKLIDLQARMNK